MIRGMTLLWTALALIIGVGLFMLKYEVASLEDRLAGLNRDIYQNQQAIHVLKAEWSYLNDPDRLRELNERHLGLAPIAPARVASIETIPLNTSPAQAPAGDALRALASASPKPDNAAKAEPAKPAAVKRAPKPPTAPAVPAAAPAARQPAPVVTAAATPAPAPARTTRATTAAPPPAPVRPTLPAVPVAAVAAPPAMTHSLPVESRSNIVVIKSPALLDAEVSSRRTAQ